MGKVRLESRRSPWRRDRYWQPRPLSEVPSLKGWLDASLRTQKEARPRHTPCGSEMHSGVPHSRRPGTADVRGNHCVPATPIRLPSGSVNCPTTRLPGVPSGPIRLVPPSRSASVKAASTFWTFT